MTTTTNLSVLDFNFEISVLKHEEIQSPWNPEMGRVTKYLLQVRNADTDTDFTFDYHTSIFDCNSNQRDLIASFNEWLLCGGDVEKQKRRRSNLRSIGQHTHGSDSLTFNEQKWIEGKLRDYRHMVEGGTYFPKKLNEWAVYEIAKYLSSDEVWKNRTSPDVTVLVMNPHRVAPKMIDEQGLKEAFRFLVSDAILGTYDIDTFQSELGYTKVSECLQVHRACQRLLRDLAHLGVNEEELYDVLNALQEMDIC